jgi:hypothetical protein
MENLNLCPGLRRSKNAPTMVGVAPVSQSPPAWDSCRPFWSGLLRASQRRTTSSRRARWSRSISQDIPSSETVGMRHARQSGKAEVCLGSFGQNRVSNTRLSDARRGKKRGTETAFNKGLPVSRLVESASISL